MKTQPRSIFAVAAIVFCCFALHSKADVVLLPTDTGFRETISEGHNQYLLGHPSSNMERDNKANWLLFDLSSVNEPVRAAELWLYLPVDGYISPDAYEVVTLRDANTARPLDGTDLRTGVLYGSQIIRESNEDSIVKFSLNADAINDINGALGGLFAIGGANSTEDLLRPASENIFAYSFPAPDGSVQLHLSVVPEPESLCLFILGAFLLWSGSRTWLRHGKCLALRDVDPGMASRQSEGPHLNIRHSGDWATAGKGR